MEEEYRNFIIDFLREYSNLEDIEEIVDESVNESYFNRAITHSSVNKVMNYEELEFLGDRRLKSTMNSYLFLNFNDIEEKQRVFSEMQLYLDSEIFLIELSESIGLDKFIKISDQKVDRNKVKEDVFEAFIGAIYLSLFEIEGIEFAAGHIETIVHNIMSKEGVTPERRHEFQMFKNKLVSFLASSGISKMPKYNIKKKTNNNIYCTVSVNGREIGAGKGKNKSKAENLAAKDALKNLSSPLLLSNMKKNKY